MADAPDPITSPPALGFQPYDATSGGAGDDGQSAPAGVYAASGGSGSGDPWPKVQEGGAADFRTGRVTGGWPGNGTSDAGMWTQC